jgi:glutamate racemase
MKIGVFDSGLGGLFTMSALTKALPQYDYVYLGDTKRLPYGSRSHEVIYQFLKEGVDFLFSKDCELIIVACNTASAHALRELQQKYLPKAYPRKRVLGMIVPMSESCNKFSCVGLVATSATISSNAYPLELKKRSPKTKLFSLATPLLVPHIESGDTKFTPLILKDYLRFFDGKKIEALVLGCTHYGIIKKDFQKYLPKNVVIISQNDVVPQKTKDYLVRHPEIENKLSRGKTREFYVTDITETMKKLAIKWFGKKITIHKVDIENMV